MRFCPQCSLILEAVDWNGIPIHACRSCGGCWMAREVFTATADADRARFAELERLFPSAASAGMFEGLPKACPQCRTAFLERQEIVPGASPCVCAQCGGVWIQSGEPGLRDTVVPQELALTTASTASESPAPAAAVAVTESPVAAEPAKGPSEEVPPTTAVAVAAPEPAAASPVIESSVAEDDSFIYEPDAVGPEEVEEAAEEEEGTEPPVVNVPQWLPHVSETMPDPRPPSRRGAPLTADAEEPAVAPPPVYAPQRWCPQCRRPYYGGEVECATCRVGLAEANYRVRCMRCGNENTISAERCWNCHAKMHPDSSEVSASPPPPLPTAADLRRWKSQGMDRPPGSSSCGTSVLVWVIGGSILAGVLMALLER